MSKRGSRNNGRRTASAQSRAVQSKRSKTTIWHNRKAWLAGALGTVVTGVVTGVAINISNNVLAAHNIAASPVQALPTLAKTTSPVSSHGPRPSRSAVIGPPLTVVSEDPINLDSAGVWAFPGKVVFTASELKTLNTYPPGMATPSFMSLLFSMGAYEERPDTQLVLQNNQAEEIRVLNMNVVKSCHAPLTGTLIYSPDAGADPSIQVGFNLDSTDTEAETLGTGTLATSFIGKPDYFEGRTVSIQPGAQQVFNIVTRTSKHSCSFRFLLTLLVGSKKTYQLIGDGNQPFRVTAVVRTKDYRPIFSAYDVIYAGGVASPASPRGDDRFVRVNPKTFNA